MLMAIESESPSKPREVDGELVHHTITELLGTRPPFKQPYRMSPTEIKEMKKTLDTLGRMSELPPNYPS